MSQPTVFSTPRVPTLQLQGRGIGRGPQVKEDLGERPKSQGSVMARGPALASLAA